MKVNVLQKGFIKRSKQKIWHRDNFTCKYCGLFMKNDYDKWKNGDIKRKTCLLSVDHIKPLSKGGSWELENLTTACMKCNSLKADNEI
jgi:5-methylcytosine-specific restriction endonuclease McrA